MDYETAKVLQLSRHFDQLFSFPVNEWVSKYHNLQLFYKRYQETFIKTNFSLAQLTGCVFDG